MQDTQETTEHGAQIEAREATTADLNAFAQRTGQRFKVQGTPLTVAIMVCPICGDLYAMQRDAQEVPQCPLCSIFIEE